MFSFLSFTKKLYNQFPELAFSIPTQPVSKHVSRNVHKSVDCWKAAVIKPGDLTLSPTIRHSAQHRRLVIAQHLNRAATDLYDLCSKIIRTARGLFPR